MRTTLLLVFLAVAASAEAGLPDGFVYLNEIDPTIATEVRYASPDNFVGKRVDGYRARKIVVTRQAAEALKKIQADLVSRGLGLKVFDGYRPQRAVNHFVRWVRDRHDTRTKEKYYPKVDKSRLMADGYIASRSRHSSGSTVDLALVDKAGKELDMGTPFDFFGPESGHGSGEVTAEQRKNRETLRSAMSQGGFSSYHKEWWHYTLRGEPFPGRYFDFPVE